MRLGMCDFVYMRARRHTQAVHTDKSSEISTDRQTAKERGIETQTVKDTDRQRLPANPEETGVDAVSVCGWLEEESQTAK